MREAHYFYVPNAAETDELPLDETIHAIRVLRLKPKDQIYLMDGVGSFYLAEVKMASSKHCLYKVKEVLKQNPSWKGQIHLAIAPTKDMGRMEWMVEKATEIGFNKISFLNSKFSERHVIKTDRIERIVISAMKQSRKPWKPLISPIVDFKDFIKNEKAKNKFICHCYDEIPRKDFFANLDSNNDDIVVMIGPEGDFSIDEVKAALSLGYESVTLGKSRLRTETAGLNAVMMANLALRL
ncbi:RsmE family RNA methyltransferase [Prevotella corporis]|uniref:RsmE family RNA methyltransferase n=1 Tax=Prevotella corporis TaxID=28128 RepID=UPI000420F634|nr:16S rRNA (uracil(1498)-N(3))-methyltransferase [Prevotella corporis]MDQ7736929.1 16S rRNA (uracil(1498)-N(3))-methyltransferase [Prevotella corporis]